MDTALSNAELELTQKIQMHFPRGQIASEKIKVWNGLPSDSLTAHLLTAFSNLPETKSKESFHSLGITLSLPSQPICTVASVFTNKSISVWRDPDFDNLLPATLPASEGTSVSGYELTKTTTEAELIKNGKPFTNLLQIEDLILRTEKGEKTGLITNGCANIFFLEVGGSVFVVSAHRYVDEWYVRLHHFYAGREWYAEVRFFSGN